MSGGHRRVGFDGCSSGQTRADKIGAVAEHQEDAIECEVLRPGEAAEDTAAGTGLGAVTGDYQQQVAGKQAEQEGRKQKAGSPGGRNDQQEGHQDFSRGNGPAKQRFNAVIQAGFPQLRSKDREMLKFGDAGVHQEKNHQHRYQVGQLRSMVF